MRSTLCVFLFLSIGVVFAGCTTHAPDGRDQPGDYANLLEEVGGRDDKSDVVVACGESTCSAARCGYDCTGVDAACTRVCAETDTRADAFVAFSATGSHAVSRDSRDFAYAPVFRLDDVLFYGCDLWDYTNAGRNPGKPQGLAIQYAEIYEGAFLAGDPEDHGYELEIYAEPFHGPGTYPAEARFSVSSAQRDDGDYFRGADACTLTVEAAGDGLVGAFSCSVPHATIGARSVSLSGSFACGAAALDLNIIDMLADQ